MEFTTKFNAIPRGMFSNAIFGCDPDAIRKMIFDNTQPPYCKCSGIMRNNNLSPIVNHYSYEDYLNSTTIGIFKEKSRLLQSTGSPLYGKIDDLTSDPDDLFDDYEDIRFKYTSEMKIRTEGWFAITHKTESEDNIFW